MSVGRGLCHEGGRTVSVAHLDTPLQRGGPSAGEGKNCCNRLPPGAKTS